MLDAGWGLVATGDCWRAKGQGPSSAACGVRCAQRVVVVVVVRSKEAARRSRSSGRIPPVSDPVRRERGGGERGGEGGIGTSTSTSTSTR
jgi:hypothetical protein